MGTRGTRFVLFALICVLVLALAAAK